MDIEIIDGKIYGVTFTDQFSVEGADKVKRVFKGKLSFDGMAIEDVLRYAFEHAKVVIRRTTLKDMKGDIEKFDRQTVLMAEHMTSSKGGQAAKVAELQAQIEGMQRAFLELSMNEAIKELGADASKDAIGNRGMEIYRTKYEPVIKAQN